MNDYRCTKGSVMDQSSSNAELDEASSFVSGKKRGAPASGGTKNSEPKRRKKPKDKPKRPLSAYNIFFRDERSRILGEKVDDELKSGDEGVSNQWLGIFDDTFSKESDSLPSASSSKRVKSKKSPHGKISFQDLAKVIGNRWRKDVCTDPKRMAYYKSIADREQERYRQEMEAYNERVREGSERSIQEKLKIQEEQIHYRMPSPTVSENWAVSPEPVFPEQAQISSRSSSAAVEVNNSNDDTLTNQGPTISLSGLTILRIDESSYPEILDAFDKAQIPPYVVHLGDSMGNVAAYQLAYVQIPMNMNMLYGSQQQDVIYSSMHFEATDQTPVMPL